jgi:hypothetical protein
MKNTQFKSIRKIMFFVLLICTFSTCVQAGGPITFQPLVGSSLQEIPVCFDDSTGELGQCSTVPKTSYARSVLVSQSGTGDFTSPIDALAAVDTWCTNNGGLSTFNRCEIRIGPGVYPLGTESLEMVDFVDIRGSGNTTTVITGNVDFDTNLDPRGVVNSAQASISDLSIYNVSANANPNFAAIVILVSTQNFRMDNVFAVKNSAATAGGVGAVVVLNGGNAIVRNSLLFGQGGDDAFGLLVEESTATVRNSVIWARNGVNNSSVEVASEGVLSRATILNSTTDEINVGGNAAAELYFHWSSAKTGVTVNDGATGVCMYSFEEDSLTPLNSDCSL